MVCYARRVHQFASVKLRRRPESYTHRHLIVSDASIFIHAQVGLRSPGVSISIKGKLDTKVLAADMAEVSVKPGVADELLGGATGVSLGVWQVYVQIGREQFNALLGLATAKRLTHVQLLFDPIRRGKGALRSVGFATEPMS